MIGRVNCASFDDAIKKIKATQHQYDLQGDWNLEAVKRFLSEQMKENDNLNFGDYVVIEMKRYGGDNEMYLHKVIGTSKSNHWVGVPVQEPAREELRGEIREVVSCICCGVVEDKVLKYRIEDVKKASKNEWNI